VLGEDGGAVARASALLQTLSRLAYFAGPALGGALLAAFGAATVLLLDAGTFVLSPLLVAAFVPAAPPRAAPPAGVAGGWRFIRRDAWMRPVTGAQSLSQGAYMAMTAAIPVLAFASDDRDPRLAGLLLAAWGGGAMAGSLLAFRPVRSGRPRAPRRRRRGRCRRCRSGACSSRARRRRPWRRSPRRGSPTACGCRRSQG
jgi:hypothetical protein